jgi:aflatoxin B1 aldehyde reductase
MAETALRWCVHHSKLNAADGGKDGVIIGASSIGQLENNITDLEKGPLPEDVVQALDEAWLIVKSTTADFWHGDLKYTYNTQEALFGSIEA